MVNHGVYLHTIQDDNRILEYVVLVSHGILTATKYGKQFIKQTYIFIKQHTENKSHSDGCTDIWQEM